MVLEEIDWENPIAISIVNYRKASIFPAEVDP
jgi:hypothetical protein